MIVLHLVKTSDAAGWALHQMQDLVKSGCEVHVAMPAGGKLVEEYEKSGIIIHYISYSLKRIQTTISQLRSIIDNVHPDLIHSHFYVCTLIMRLGLRHYDIPRLFQLPGPSHLYYPALKWIELFLAQKKLDYWIGACKMSQEAYMKSGIAPSRVFLSYYGGDKIDMDVQYKNENKLRHELGLPDSAIMIGMISYMYPPKWYLGQKRGIKGHEDFIEAIAIAAKQNPAIYGLCIGGAWNGATKYERSIHKFAERLTNNVIFCGTRHDVPSIYPELYCAVQPSHQENLGGAAQALRYGCPIIATNTGGLPDLVINGETGYLVPVKDSKSLADAILRIVENPEKAQEMLNKGRDLYYQIRKSSKGSVLKIYNRVLSDHRGA